MKKILVILFLFYSQIAAATDYYVNSMGNDLSDGLSPSTPWKTISKVNAEFYRFNPGDRILFKSGHSFYGGLIITKSGISGKPITIGSYDAGTKPVISGFTTLSSWTNEGSGIYSAVLNTPFVLNNVILNGVHQPVGRWPNSGWRIITSHSGNTSITDNTLTGSPDWSDAEVVIKKNRWTIDQSAITDHANSTIIYKSGSNYEPANGYGYFIQKSKQTLDLVGEWYHDQTNGRFYMYFGSNNPVNYTVRVSTVNELYYSRAGNYITIDGLAFEGGNYAAIHRYQTNYNIVRNCDFNFLGCYGIYGQTDSYSTTEKNNFRNCLEMGLYFDINGHHQTIINNSLSDVGLIPGMGFYRGSGLIGILIYSNNTTIENNTVENTGYNGISFGGSYITVKNNIINKFCSVTDDGAGIYTYTGSTGIGYDRHILNNLVLNGIGNNSGTDSPSWFFNVAGICLDNRSENVEVSGNTIANIAYNGIILHNASNCQFENNTIYNCTAHQFITTHDDPDFSVKNNRLSNNIFFSKIATQTAFEAIDYLSDNLRNFFVSDNNYFCRPIDDNLTFYTQQPSTGGVNRNLAGWQSFSGQDKNSHKSPITLTDVNKIRFEYNATSSQKIIALDGAYIDVKGTKYSGTITLLPYTSAILMVDPNPAPPPAIPAYVSSVIENTTPDRLSMTYNLALANIVPSASAFTVRVNSASRTVTAVAISGTKVNLTLASPVAYGETVTVAYTKPATNPLQTTAGGQASTMAAQTVTNNVAAPPAVPVYLSSVIENAAPALLSMTYNLALANIVPSASAFAVRVNSVSRTVTAVSISGTKVNLTLASPVAYGETVTVAYTKPAANPLQTTAGGQAVTIAAQTVTNSIGAPPAIPVYVGAVIENATPAQIDMTYNLPLASIIPSVSAFTVIVNSAAKSVVSVVVSGTKVLLTFSGPLVYGDVVTVAYTKPSSNPLQTPAGGQAATISAQTVTNKINAPVAPVYLGSSVENSAPSVLEITYDKALANIVPASSAFTAQVNSVTRNISSVAISGTKVLLNLSSPVVFNDVITFSYTKPSSNALQTASGGQAESISAQAATNRVNMVNSPPVIRINYPSSTYSGFLGEINATGSYDPNKDNLTYTWKVPDKVSVSSTNGSIIQFLAPVVEAVRRLDFTLTVNDGKTTGSETISIEILPYQPELELAEVIAVEASGFQYPHYPINIIDGNIATLWSADGTDQWITLELKEPFNIHHVILAFQSGLTREYYFDVLGSEDKVTWEPILTKSRSCAFSGDFQVFDFPPSKTGKEFKYVRLICQGNLADTWNNIAELRIFGYRFRTPSDYEKQTVKIFPNPAHNYFNVKIEESSVIHDYLRIINLSGNILLHKKIDPGVSEFHVPINLIKGVYLIQLGSEKIISYCQKLIVVN